jgi:hypothetical protein
VARTRADGYTLILLTGGHAVSAAMYKTLAFDPVEDFDWISMVTRFPFVLATAQDSPYKSIADVVRAAKANGVQDIDEITALHVHDTINDLVSRSKVVREALESGKLAVVGANYKLVLGDIHPLVMLGQVTQ